MSKPNNQSTNILLRYVRALLTRTGFVITSALVLFALATLALGLPTLAQTPVDPSVPTGMASVDPAAFTPSSDPDQPAFAPGELLVGMREDAASSVANAAEATGYSVDSQIATGTETVAQVVAVPVGEELAAAQKLAAQPGVLYVEPNYYVYAAQEDILSTDAASVAAAATPPEPYAVDDTFYASKQWNMQRVNAARAWQLALDSGYFDAPSNTVVVAVIDSGVDPTHPELEGRLLAGKNYITLAEELPKTTFPYIDCQAERFDAPMLDTYGHGTHVAGIIAAQTNNAAGVAGVAPVVKIDPRRVLNCTGSGTINNVAQAIRDAADAGADIINLSLVVKTYSQTIDAAVQYAYGKDALLFAASGNANMSVYYPAALPEVVAVGALDYFDDATSYSNFGPEVALSAPGGDATYPVFSTWPSPASFPLDANNQPYTRCANHLNDGDGYYCTNYGTSFATPLVSGVAALMLSLDPTLTPAQIRNILVQTATPLADQDALKVGAGKLNAYAAVRALIAPTLALDPGGLFDEVQATDDPYTVTLRIENQSLTSLDWEAKLATANIQSADTATPALANTTWISLTSGTDNQQTGSAAFGAPGFLTMRVDPAALQNGFNTGEVTAKSTSPGQTQPTLRASISVFLGELLMRIGLPVIFNGAVPNGTIPLPGITAVDASADSRVLAAGEQASYAWATPSDAASVLVHTIPANGDIGVALPYPVVIKGESFQNLRIHENGFVVLPNTLVATVLTGENRCLPITAPYGTQVFGWWADLDASATGAKVSSFAASGQRYVIQYENLPVLGAPVPYKVTFQIVFDQTGTVRMNYKDVPDPVGKPPQATIGVQSTYGLFYSELLCSTSTQTFGSAPSSNESIVFRSSDLY